MRTYDDERTRYDARKVTYRGRRVRIALVLGLISAGAVTIAAQPQECIGVHTANIQQAINANPPGTTFCLSGTYEVSQTIRPKAGDTFVGPANLAGDGARYGIETKPQAPGARFIDLDVSGFEIGLRCWDEVEVSGGRYHHNTAVGIGCGLEGGSVLIENVEADHNGSSEEVGSSAAGMKFAQGHGIVVRDSFVHDNTGNGVWCDVQCGDYTVVGNTITGNFRKGIHYEKSGESDFNGIFYEGQATITGNTVQDNGNTGEPGASGGIVGVSSKNMLIEDNTLGGNVSAGIKMRQDSRLRGEKHGWRLSNIVISANELNGDRLAGCNLSGVTCSGNG